MIDKGDIMIKRFIWDFDGTIVDGDFSIEENLFRDNLSEEDFLKFNEKWYELLNVYEKEFPKYDRKMLSEFLSTNTGVTISEKLIDEWSKYMINVNETIHPGAVAVLDYLQNKGYENIIYTNAFTNTQVGRIKKLGFSSYFKEIIDAEEFIKPTTEGFIKACGPHKPNECVMIGDNYNKDILGALKAGLNVIYYCPKGLPKEVDVPHVKKLIKIKEMY